MFRKRDLDVSVRSLFSRLFIRTHSLAMSRFFFDVIVRMTVISLLLVSVALKTMAANIARKGLFETTDNVEILNNQTYQKWLQEGSPVKIVLFYASWCGHCQRFAPVFKSTVDDITGWYPVVDVGVVNCADDENNELCRDNKINGFPTTKIFWIEQEATGSTAEEVISSRTPDTIRVAIVDFIEKKYKENGKPHGFPTLTVSSVTSLDQLWNSFSTDVKQIFVVVEEAESYCGRELILDFSSNPAVGVVRFLRGNGPEEIRNRDSLSLIQLERGVHPRVIASEASAEKARTVFKEKLIKAGYVFNAIRHSNKTVLNHGSVVIGKYDKIYLDDLETGLLYTLNHEIALKQDMSQKELRILKGFLQLFSETIDFPSRIQKYLQNIVRGVNASATLANSAYMALLESAKTPDAYLRTHTDFIGCRGSLPGKRGYTCSLWLLLHLATVGSHNRFLRQEIPNANEAMFIIRDYILNFFSCSDCTEHFRQTSQNLESELVNPEESALWLWRAHNKINARLKGDVTEDPQRPKVQFPPRSLCSECHNGEHFDESLVLKFLHRFYNSSNMIVRNKAQTSELLQGMTESASNTKYFSGFDLTIFLVIYAVSITLLFVVFIAMMCRRRKVNFSKSLSSLL